MQFIFGIKNKVVIFYDEKIKIKLDVICRILFIQTRKYETKIKIFLMEDHSVSRTSFILFDLFWFYIVSSE